MTVVATLQIANCPMLIGDLLLSAEIDRNSTPVRVPAVGDVTEFFEGSGWAFTGLRQKIALVSDRCAVGWAGRRILAATAIEHLREMAGAAPLTAEAIQHYLNTTPELQTDDLAFVGWVVEDIAPDGQIRIVQFHHKGQEFEVGRFGYIHAAGSGAYAVQQYATMVEHDLPTSVAEDIRSPTAIATCLGAAGLLLSAEMRGGDAAPTLRTFFGGGYEVAGFFNGRFQKFGDLTYFLWRADVHDGRARIRVPELIVKQAYVDDILVLMSARVEVDSQGPHIADAQWHEVRPNYPTLTQVTDEQRRSISLTSRLTCHCVQVVPESGVVAMFSMVDQRAETSDLSISFEEVGGHLGMRISPRFLQGLADAIEAGPPEQERGFQTLREG